MEKESHGQTLPNLSNFHELNCQKTGSVWEVLTITAMVIKLSKSKYHRQRFGESVPMVFRLNLESISNLN